MREDGGLGIRGTRENPKPNQKIHHGNESLDGSTQKVDSQNFKLAYLPQKSR